MASYLLSLLPSGDAMDTIAYIAIGAVVVIIVFLWLLYMD